MARPKPKWRRMLTARYLRWQALRWAVRLAPGLGRHLRFFPDAIDMIEGADDVLADAPSVIPAKDLERDLAFLDRCLENDSTAPGLDLRAGLRCGRRTALYHKAWVDMATGSVLLPDRRKTVIVRGGQANWNATSARLGRQVIDMPGRVFVPLNTVQYFHLLLENGVRLLDLLAEGQVADAPLTLVKGPDRSAVETAMYDGIAAISPGLSLRRVSAGALLRPDTAVVHFPHGDHWEWPPIDRTLANRLAEAFNAVYSNSRGAAGSARLYLSRTGAKLRNPVNAREVDALLARHDFDTFIATDKNHPEQIARFRAARTVVAVHGAGLTNLIFCAPGTRVIEIFPENFVKSPYWWICRQLGLVHIPVIGGPGDYDQNFAVQIPVLEEALAQIPADSA